MSLLRATGSIGTLSLCFVVACTADRQMDVQADVIAVERAALDRWGKGETAGYTDIYADEVTYFDPDLPARLDGLEAVRRFLAPFDGTFKIERYDMINPKVQVHGDTAVLTFDLVDHTQAPDGAATTEAWHSTEVYTRAGGKWRIIHAHWSKPKPRD